MNIILICAHICRHELSEIPYHGSHVTQYFPLQVVGAFSATQDQGKVSHSVESLIYITVHSHYPSRGIKLLLQRITIEIKRIRITVTI